MANNSQSRKWALVINNPLDAGLDHTAIAAILALFSPAYYCMADEIAATGTFHTHKAETTVAGSFMEWGTLPAEKEETDPELYRLIRELREGKRTAEIIEQSPKYAFRVRDIDTLRQTLLADRFATENRKLEVAYLYGDTGAGKTRSIYESHDPREICRVTNYRKGVSFDAYNGQDVLVFEEFHSQIPIGDMLNYLDIYPLSLPARYTDRTACYTKVYITSNLPLTAQYRDEQYHRREIWAAFLRRIHKVIEFHKDGTAIERWDTLV